jgi:hypothetical protein
MIHKIEHRMANLFPDNYIPLVQYGIIYRIQNIKHALKYGNEQQEAILNLIEKYNYE